MKPKYKYELLVHFNEYTGNFHREFNAFVAAFDNDYNTEEANRLLEVGKTALFKPGVDPDDASDELFEYFHHFYDEYGGNISSLTQVPNAKGKFECNGITLYFDKDPTPILPTILKQIAAFPKAAGKYARFAPKKLKVLKIELATETIHREVKELSL